MKRWATEEDLAEVDAQRAAKQTANEAPHDNGLADDAKHGKGEHKHPAGFRMTSKGLIWSDPSSDSEKREIVYIARRLEPAESISPQQRHRRRSRRSCKAGCEEKEPGAAA